MELDALGGQLAVAHRHQHAAAVRGRLEAVGQIGVDPGTEWGTGATSTADNTIRRIATVSAGDPDGSNPFDPAAEWEGFALNTLDGIGAHTFDPGGGNQPRHGGGPRKRSR